VSIKEAYYIFVKIISFAVKYVVLIPLGVVEGFGLSFT